MAYAFIIYGMGGTAESNWFPWLKSELEKVGFEVIIPKFPTPEKQSLNSWLNVFEKYEHLLGRDSILCGHSLGCAFILTLLEKLKHPIKAAFLVAPFTNLENNLEINKSFTDREFNWKNIRKNCQRFFVYGSDNDPYIPLVNEREFAESLGVDLKIINKAGHFNSDSGYIEFSKLLTDIKEVT